jgi:hypothetical protein
MPVFIFRWSGVDFLHFLLYIPSSTFLSQL